MNALNREFLSKIEGKAHFEIFKRKADSSEILPISGVIKNQITDFGYQSIYGTIANPVGNNSLLPNTTNNNYGAVSYIKIGASTTPIAPADTGMSSILYTQLYSTSWPASPIVTQETIEGVKYYKAVFWYVFGLGVLDDVTFTQLGLFSGNNNTSLICGQLTKNEFGTPTAITILSSEQLMVKYTLYLPSTFSVPDPINFNLSGVDYTASLVRIQDLIDTGGIVRNLAASNNLYVNSSTSIVGTFTVVTTLFANRIERVITVPIATLAYTNNISNILFGSSFASAIFRLEFVPVIPKTAYNSLTFSFRWILTWREV